MSQANTDARALLEAVGPRLRRYLLILAGTAEDADDLLQSVYVRFLEEPPQGTRERQEAWLFTVARNLAFTSTRDRQRRVRREQGAVRSDAPPTPADQAERREDLERMRNALAGLPLDLKEPLYLKVVEHLSFSQISERTGVPKSTVALRVQEGLVLLNRRFHEVSHA
ncbi:MAG: RNA polymerase sigma factor [Planctomycetota bacterium]|nr:RNA polymerase sigma factor [Planctomycetota bacterium]